MDILLDGYEGEDNCVYIPISHIGMSRTYTYFKRTERPRAVLVFLCMVLNI